MTSMVFLSSDDVAQVLRHDDLDEALRRAFVAHSEGRTSVPPRPIAKAPAGLLATMPGFVADGGLAAKVITVFPGNHGTGVPSHQGVVVVFDPSTGTPQALLDAAAVTAYRTAASTAVAVDLLARADASVLTIIGAGVQGRSHISAVVRTRTFNQVRVCSRSSRSAAVLASDHDDAEIIDDFRMAVDGADVVCLCTDSREPIIAREWLARGALVTSVGTGHELDAATVAAGRVFVEWRGAALHPPPTGAAELQGIDADALTELGEVLAGQRPGREDDGELVVYKSTGHAVEDIAAARVAVANAATAGVGQRVTL